MKPTATTTLTLDGVYQGPGGLEEDRRGVFDRGGWIAPHLDEETGRFPHHDAGDPISFGTNALPKYVPSTTLNDPGWNTHVIPSDVETAVREPRARSGHELQVHGSRDLLRGLLERDLVGELYLEVYPMIVGQRLRLFPERGQTHDPTLVGPGSTPSGVTIQNCRPAGRATFGTVGE